MTSNTHADEAVVHEGRSRQRRKQRVAAPTRAPARVHAWWVVLFAGAAGGFAGVHPTGWQPGDIVVTGLFAALVSLAASRARRWTWLWISGIAFGAAGGAGIWVGVGLATFLFAVWTVI